MWVNNMIQILQQIPSIHSLYLVYDWCEMRGHSFLEWLSPRILHNGQVDCLIPKLKTIFIRLDNQLVTPRYGILTEMILSRCSLAQTTNAGNISGPIERIEKVEVECFYDESWDGKDDTTWYKEVSEMLAPLRGVVDTVRVVIN